MKRGGALFGLFRAGNGRKAHTKKTPSSKLPAGADDVCPQNYKGEAKKGLKDQKKGLVGGIKFHQRKYLNREKRDLDWKRGDESRGKGEGQGEGVLLLSIVGRAAARRVTRCS